MSDSVIPWTVTLQAPLSTGFSRQNYWTWLPALLQGIFLTQGFEPAFTVSPALAGGFFTASTIWEALKKLEP